mmetsp:Transcript_43177/g.101194  ORF Transcript_43177/g.101194 Transcript_43177/m.101194 type:complete len:100 (-) Transcript_43177:209-508(-)
MGPSLRCVHAELLQQLLRIEVKLQQLVVWVVDAEDELWRVLLLGLRVVVSNEPIRLLANLSAVQSTCASPQQQGQQQGRVWQHQLLRQKQRLTRPTLPR